MSETSDMPRSVRPTMATSLGTAVLFGMIGVTCFGLLFTPAFYTFIRRLGRKEQTWCAACDEINADDKPVCALRPTGAASGK